MNDWDAKKEKARLRQALLNKARLYVITHGVSSPREFGCCPLGEKCPHFRGEGVRCRLQGLHVNRRLYAVFEKGAKAIAIVNARKSKQYPSRLCVSGLVPEESKT